MKITWFGHSCFLIEDSKGRKILTDPFDDSIGYKVYEGSADVVTISHHHFDHDHIDTVKDNPQVIDKCGLFYAADIPISGIASYHDKVQGAKRGENIIYIYKIDGFTLCHLGDLGHELSDDTLEKIGRVDVLFVPVGGNYTLDGDTAAKVCKKINSHIVIPMHYKTSYLSFPLGGVEKFLIKMKNGDKVDTNTIELNEIPKEYNVVKILKAIQ